MYRRQIDENDFFFALRTDLLQIQIFGRASTFSRDCDIILQLVSQSLKKVINLLAIQKKCILVYSSPLMIIDERQLCIYFMTKPVKAIIKSVPV